MLPPYTYNHTASQGYQPDVHYQPLSEAVSNWCLKQPVKDWKVPPDQYSCSTTPVIPPKSGSNSKPRSNSCPHPCVVTMTITPAPTKVDKGKGKQPAKGGQSKPQISPEFVTDMDSNIKPDQAANVANPLPLTDHLQDCVPKCD